MSNIRSLILGCLAVASITLCPAPVSAQQLDVIRGTVTGPDGRPLESVKVTATSVSGNVNRTARTDRNGRFAITFPGGEGDYFVEYAAIGYGARRFQVKRTADQEILVADARLNPAAGQLDSVRVEAQRDRPNRNDNRADISGSERPVDNSGVPADQQGDIAAMAASMPGVQLVPGSDGDPSGFSVLGLSPDQNSTTLNGMQFGGSNIPRDAAVSSSLATTPYDVSRGGFSGAQFNVRGRPGSNYMQRTVSVNLDAPQLQWTDRAAQSLGQQYSNVSLGGLFSGPIKYDQSFYNLSYQIGRRANDLRTLLNTDALGLQTSGVAADSVARLLGILQKYNIPTVVGALPSDRLGQQGSFFGTIDVAPPSSSTGQSFNVSFNGNWNRLTPASPLTSEFPTHSGDRTNWNGGLQARHGTYFGVGILSETSGSLTRSRNYSNPYLEMSSGTVRIRSVFDDGTSGLKTIAFGGSPSMSNSSTNTGAELSNQLSLFSGNNKHRIKFTSEIRRDGFNQDQQTNLLGSFSFNSLADLEANRPAAFSRQLSPRVRSGSQLIGAVSLGDSYRRTDNLQLQYGVRVDGNRFTSMPDANPELERVFGERNDRVPNKVYFSPRAGFSYTYGTAPEIAGFMGAVRGPRAVIRGGIGMFQSTPGTNLIGSALDNTGLPGSLQQLFCGGAASPVPDYTGYAGNPENIPTECRDGSVFASSVPNVTFFAENYAAPRSLRSNLNWSGAILGNRFAANVEATYSRNRNQAGIVDLNFNPTLRFSLADEDNRPVYVHPTSIFPSTGTIASRDARVSQLFSRVTELRSDLRSESRQISFRLSPTSFRTNYSWGVGYVLGNVRERVRGFTNTAGNPLDVEWARSQFDSRHQITYNLGYNFLDAVRLNWFGSFRSGNPYTPLIAGDVNGDGYGNDRAFIFNPAQTADPALASAMQNLLATAPGNVRNCLENQLGKLAGRNSCQGPWTSQASLTLSLNPIKFRLPQRANVSFQISNPLGAADMLLHDDSKLRGWGQFSFSDPTLLQVRGFDPVSRRYRYDVNERFGSTSLATASVRNPVTVTAMMRFDLGPTRERQQLTQQLDRGRRGRGERTPEPMLRAMYSSGGLTNPLAAILRQSDTLGLSGMQADSIATMNRRYVIRLDSIWSPVVAYYAALPKSYDQDDAYRRYRVAREASVDMLIRIAPDLKRLLTSEQRRKLPANITSFLDTRYLAAIRSGTAGGAGGMMSFPGGMMMQGGGPGRGARETIIIRQ